MSEVGHNHEHHKYCSHQLDLKRRKTALVLLISLITMILEIVFGYITHSVALLSDGWHMASHVVAIGASWLAYHFVLRKRSRGKTVDTAKALTIVGFLNALALAIIAITVVIECVSRLNEPVSIHYQEAILVSVIGLIVNLVSVKILHHHEEHSDHNIKAAYLHVLADVLTSSLALIALVVGYFTGLSNIDTIVGIFGSLVILNWSRQIIIRSIKEVRNG